MQVDETLFKGPTKAGDAGVSVLSKAKYSNIQALVGEQGAVVSTSELQRMKDTASGEIERREFPDGEHYRRLLTEVSGRNVVILGGTVSDHDTLEISWAGRRGTVHDHARAKRTGI